MIFSLTQFLILGLATFLFVGGLTPVMRKIAIKIGAVDRPNLDRKTQKEPVPYLGGVAIAIGTTVASFGALLYSDFSTETFNRALSVLLPAILISAMGLYDDLKGLEPWPRLVAQTITGIAVAIYLIQNDYDKLVLDYQSTISQLKMQLEETTNALTNQTSENLELKISINTLFEKTKKDEINIERKYENKIYFTLYSNKHWQ